MDEAFRAGVERGERRIVDEAGEDHAIARHMPIGERITQDRRELSELARDNKTQVPVAIGRLSERTEKAPHVLPGIELADVEDVAVGHTEPLLREPAALLARRRDEGLVNGLGHDRHAVFRDTKPLDDVALGRFRDRDHPIGTACKRVLPGMTRARIRQPEVMLGPDERRDVVDRDDRGERAPRRERQLRRVVDVRFRAGELEREQDRIEREHRELRTPEPCRRQVFMGGEKAGVRGREVPQPQQDPFDISRSATRERGQEISRVAANASHARHGLQMARVERYSHRS